MFSLISKKCSVYFCTYCTSQFLLHIFQMLGSHMWLVATILDSTGFKILLKAIRISGIVLKNLLSTFPFIIMEGSCIQ